MELWYPKAKRWIPKRDKRRDGPGKPYANPNTVSGIVNHSAVGYVGGLHDVLERPDNEREAAWHFSVLYDGTVEQHYPLNAVLWHAGSEYAHKNLIGIEHEGGYEPINEPLRPAQLAASIELCRWIAQQGDFKLSRSGTRTLHEHNEVSTKPTGCPHARIPWTRYTDGPKPPKEAKKMSNAYIVQAGDTLGAIAKLFGQDVAALVARNGIADPNRITAGQLLYLADVPHPHVCGAVERPDVKPLRNRLEVITKSAQWLDEELAKIGGV